MGEMLPRQRPYEQLSPEGTDDQSTGTNFHDDVGRRGGDIRLMD